ncbi:MAG: chorismate mutase [Clostridiales bacterium]|nr:chorismate mutase [Clostridiales bacterium]
MEQLDRYREQLKVCDEKILQGLLERNRVVEEIMACKEKNGMKILQPDQEARQEAWLEEALKGCRHQEEVRAVFDRIHWGSKRIQARKLFSYNIVLIGFMGAGKSTISEYLNTLFAMDVVEMDQLIAQREGMSIADIFEVYGEEYFRNLETALLVEMQNRENVVISCGGGTPLRECNVREMKKNGRVVLLCADPETILERVKDSHERPLIENNKNVEYIGQLMEKRREKYEAAADIVIHTDGKSALDICEEIVGKLLELDRREGRR